MRKLRLPLLLLILCCMMFIRLTHLPFEKIGQMVSALTGDYMPAIVLDARHGGEDGGVVSRSGIAEKDINLAITMDLKPMPEMPGSRVVMIWDSDISVGDNTLDTVKARKTSNMHNWLKTIKGNDDCVFLSVHQNHPTNGKYSGTQTFYGIRNLKSQVLADTTQKTTSTLLQSNNQRGTKPATDSIHLPKNTDIPAVIVECGFFSNAGEARKLSQLEYQK